MTRLVVTQLTQVIDSRGVKYEFRGVTFVSPPFVFNTKSCHKIKFMKFTTEELSILAQAMDDADRLVYPHTQRFYRLRRRIINYLKEND